LHVRTAQPEQREVGDDAVRIGFEKILENSGGLIVTLLVI
jgi:hypothetical protein